MILQAINLSYAYKTKKDRQVLKQVSADFEEGRFYAVVGSSGSGKTTFSLFAGRTGQPRQRDRQIHGRGIYGKKGFELPTASTIFPLFFRITI